MKICPHCEYPIDENAQVCPYCGKEQTVSEEHLVDEKLNEATISTVTDSTSTDSSTISQENHQEVLSSESEVENPERKEMLSPINSSEVKQSTDDADHPQMQEKKVEASDEDEMSDFDLLKPHVAHIKGYFSQLGQTMIHPPLEKTEANPWLGIINFVLIALFYALALSRSVGQVFSSIFNSFGHYGVYFIQDLRPFPFFFGFLIGIVLLQLVAVLIYWGFAFGIMHEKMNFQQAFNRIFAPLSLLVPISLLAFLFTLVGGLISAFGFLLILLHFAFIRYSFHANIWLVENPRKHNRFYITLIPVVLYVFASIIIMQFLMHFLLMHAQLQDILQQIFNRY